MQRVLWMCMVLCLVASRFPAAEEAADPVPAETSAPVHGDAEADDVRAADQAEAKDEGREVRAEPAKNAPADTGRTETEAKKAPSAFQIRSWIRDLDAKEEKARAAAAERLLAEEAREAAASEIKAYIKSYPAARRLAAVDVLQTIANRDAREALAGRVLFDKDAEVRKRAAAAVREMGGQTAMRYILGRAFAESEKTRTAAAQAMAAINDKHYVDALLPMTRQVVAYADARVDMQARRTGLTHMNRMNVAGDFTDLAIDLPTTYTHVAKTEFWTLCMATGQDYGRDWDAWESWWQKSRATFVFPAADK